MKTKFLTDKKDIEAWLKSHNVKDFDLIKDTTYGFVVNASRVDLEFQKLKTIPVKFNKIVGAFDISHNFLTNLEFAPKSVGVSFDVRDNCLTDLIGGPLKVGGNYDCSQNKLTSLEGSPIIIKGYFDCSSNRLKKLEYGPQNVDTYDCSNNKLTSLLGAPKNISGNFMCSSNHLTTLEFCPKTIGTYFDCSHNKLENLAFIPRICYALNLQKNYKLKNAQRLNDLKQIVEIHHEHKKIFAIQKEKILLGEVLKQSIAASKPLHKI